MEANLKAFLDMIAISELQRGLIAVSDNGYNVIVGSSPAWPHLFRAKADGTPDYSDHPRVLVALRPGLRSTAAGRYQLLARFYDAYKKKLGLPDFSPASQDAIAIQQIKECHALDAIQEGYFDDAVVNCAHIWASLPGSGYGQRENKMAVVRGFYLDAGGQLAQSPNDVII